MRHFIIIEVKDEEEVSYILDLVVPVVSPRVIAVKDGREAPHYTLDLIFVAIIFHIFFIVTLFKLLFFTPLFH